jgi:peptidoglycan-associated lipoprotein
MLEYLFAFALFTTATCGAEPQFHACFPSRQDPACFRPQTVFFSTASSRLDNETKQRITLVASFLKDHPSAEVLIEGHCDDRGSEEHNRWLGDRRACAVARELFRAGVGPERIKTISFGKDRPLNAGHDATARQRNRRAQFILLKP